jgi:hypothetical protein
LGQRLEFIFSNFKYGESVSCKHSYRSEAAVQGNVGMRKFTSSSTIMTSILSSLLQMSRKEIEERKIERARLIKEEEKDRRNKRKLILSNFELKRRLIHLN